MQRIRLALIGVGAFLLAALIFIMPSPGPFWDFGDIDVYMLLAWILVSLAAASIVAIWKASFWNRAEKIDTHPRQMLPGVTLRNLPRLPRHRDVPLIFLMPNYGIFWGFIPFLLILFVSFSQRMPMGLSVHLPARHVATLPRAPESESLSVYVGTGGRYYVNGQLVAREQLRAKLQDELGRRSLWIVYFEGDEDVAYGRVVYAVDTIRGLGAQAYFLSPRIRDEFSKQADPTKR